MKYLCLLYDEEKKWADMPQSEIEAAMEGNSPAQTLGNRAAPPRPAGTNDAALRAEARAAIAGGADKSAVDARMRAWGLQP